MFVLEVFVTLGFQCALQMCVGTKCTFLWETVNMKNSFLGVIKQIVYLFVYRFLETVFLGVAQVVL